MNKIAKLGDRAAIIFGASEGTGLAVAEALAGRVSGIAILSRSRAKIDAAAARVQTTAGKVFATTADVTNADEVKRAFDSCVSVVGQASIVVNCAGAAHPGYFEDLSNDVFEDQMRRHLMGTVNVFRAAIPHLKGQKETRLVTTASVLGLFGMFGYSAYAASKHAVVGLASSLRSEYARTSMRVSVLCPPSIDTPGFAAENKIKPKDVLAAELKGGVLSPAAVADALVRALPKGPALILPGNEARLPYLIHRFAPGLLARMTARPK